MKQVTLGDGSVCKIGDVVSFKSDVEQCGKIEKINQGSFGQVELVLTSEYGFHGDYIGGTNKTIESASECWTE